MVLDGTEPCCYFNGYILATASQTASFIRLRRDVWQPSHSALQMASLASCSTSSVARRATGQHISASRMHAVSSAARRVACRAHDTSDAPATSSTLRRMAASLAAAGTAAALLAAPLPALAAGKVAEWPASGFLFKDTVEVTSFDDADVPGVTLYISDFKRSIADKLAKDFFSEPSQVRCRASSRIGALEVSGKVALLHHFVAEKIALNRPQHDSSLLLHVIVLPVSRIRHSHPGMHFSLCTAWCTHRRKAGC